MTKSVREKAGLTNEERFYTNSSESINEVLKDQVEPICGSLASNRQEAREGYEKGCLQDWRLEALSTVLGP